MPAISGQQTDGLMTNDKAAQESHTETYLTPQFQRHGISSGNVKELFGIAFIS